MRSIRTPLLVLALAGVAVGTPALAQQAATASAASSVTYPAPCDASKVTRADVDRAHTVFISGKQYLDESNYDKAISYFNDAYSIDCSVHAILPIIATAYERKGDKAEAIRALEEYLKRAPNAPDRERIERRIRNLGDQLAREAPPPPAASTAPPPAATATAAAPPAPTVEPPASASPAVAPAEVPVHHRSTTVPWLITGAGIALTAAGAAMLGIGISDVSSAQNECHGGRASCTSSAAANKGNSGLTLEDVGIPVGIVGLASAIGGAIWVVVNSSTPSPSTVTYVTPVIAPGYAGLTIRSSL